MKATLKMIAFTERGHCTMEWTDPHIAEIGSVINSTEKEHSIINSLLILVAHSIIEISIRLKNDGSNSKVSLVICRTFRQWCKGRNGKNLSDKWGDNVGPFFKRIAKWWRILYEYWRRPSGSSMEEQSDNMNSFIELKYDILIDYQSNFFKNKMVINILIFLQ